MKLQSLTVYLKNHVGLVAGIVLGLASGLGAFGVALGILIGYLTDELLRDRKVRTRAAKILQAPQKGILDDRWTKITASIGLACAVAVEEETDNDDQTQNSTIGIAEQELLKAKISTHLGLSGRQANLARLLITQVLSGPPVQTVGLAELYRSLSSETERYRLLELLFLAAGGDAGVINPGQSSLIKVLSIDLDITAEQYNTARDGAVGVDLSPYEILGISADASDAEIRRVYHRLASQFHPDTGSALERHRIDQSREAFMRIKNAYNHIIEEREARR